MREYVSIPERGVENAFVVHLRDDLFPGRRVCDGEAFEGPAGGNGQLVFCDLCRRCAANRLSAEREIASGNGKAGGY